MLIRPFADNQRRKDGTYFRPAKGNLHVRTVMLSLVITTTSGSPTLAASALSGFPEIYLDYMAESTPRLQLALMPPATRSTAARRDDGDSGAATGLQRAQQEADEPVDSRHHQGAQPSPSSSISSGPLYSPLFDVEPPGQGGYQSGVSTPMSSPPPRDDFHQVLVQWLAAQAAPRQVYLTYLDALHWTEEYILVALNCILWLGLLGGIIVYFGWP